VVMGAMLQNVPAQDVVVLSPDKQLQAEFAVVSGRLVYTLISAGAPVVEQSPFGVTVDGVDYARPKGVDITVPAGSAGAKPGWTLTFADEFDGDKLDPTKWNPRDPWGRERNSELQAYVPDAFKVKDGVLKIMAEKRKADYAGKTREYTSGMMSTYQKFAQKFGRFEIRCRIPKGKGLWPAFWLLPDPLGWPPEIDVLETLGHETNRAYFTHHWRDESRKHQSHGGHVDDGDLSAGFHTYAAEWSPEVIVWYLDGKEAFRSTRSVPKELPMYMLANLAVGGQWPGAPNADTPFPSSFDIDYIRVYTRK
jgi:beta-glucanase (GH16 family)